MGTDHRKRFWWTLGAVALIAAAWFGRDMALSLFKAGGAGEPAVSAEKKVKYWVSSMDPSYIRNEPGKDWMGMELVPVYEGEENGSGAVKINPAVEQSIGVRTAPVEKRELSRAVRASGVVAYDETRVANIQSKTAGWVEHLYIDYTGQKVEKGDFLLEIYSPELVATEDEFLLAVRNRDATMNSPDIEIAERGMEMYDAAKKRLQFLDVPDHQIYDIEWKKKILKTLHIHSPFNGVVVEKNVSAGMQVAPGMTLYTVADLSRVWVLADVYEYELQWVKVGAPVKMTLEAYPGREFSGKVTYINPFMEKETRTVKVRMEFANPRGELKPDMYAQADIAAGDARTALAVPKEAVIRGGKRDLVVVALGGGMYAPREVTLGLEAEGYFEVVNGLQEGDTVVTSAQFLIDSESSLKEAAQKMMSGQQPAVPAGHEGHTAPAPAAEHEGHQAPAPAPKHEGHDMGGMQQDHAGHDMSGMTHEQPAPVKTAKAKAAPAKKKKKKAPAPAPDHSGHDMEGMDHSSHDQAAPANEHAGHEGHTEHRHEEAVPPAEDHSGHAGHQHQHPATEGGE